MFRSLIVPLDGSPTAARALPYVPLVAEPGARITLVGVATPLLDAPGVPAKEKAAIEQLERTRAFLWQDLETHATSLRAQGFPVVTTVRTGVVTEEISTCAREIAADLIVLTTHGGSGLAYWMLDSTTQRLLHTVGLPTLIIHSAAGRAFSEPQMDHVTVPLDGSPLAERALTIAEGLAARRNLPLRLVRVVPNQMLTPARSDVAAVHGLSNSLHKGYSAAEQYVRTTVDRLRSEGRDASGEVRVGDPAATLASFLGEAPDALVVIATHGTGGDRWAFDSVADKIVATTQNPTLIVRPLAGKGGRVLHDPALAARYPD